MTNRADDIIDKLTAVGLKANWGLVDRVDCAPEPYGVIKEAIGEIQALREALREACKIIAKRSSFCPQWYFDDSCDSALVNCKQDYSDCWYSALIKRAKMSAPETPESVTAAEQWGNDMNTKQYGRESRMTELEKYQKVFNLACNRQAHWSCPPIHDECTSSDKPIAVCTKYWETFYLQQVEQQDKQE